MATTLKRIGAKTQHAVIDFDGEQLNVDFYVQRISPKMLASFTDMDKPLVGPDGGEASQEQVMERLNLAVNILVTLLADWDMVESIDEQGVAGPKVPIDAAHLSEFGLPLLWAIIGGIFSNTTMSGK